MIKYSAGVLFWKFRRCCVCGKPTIRGVEGADVDGKTKVFVYKHVWHKEDAKPKAFWENPIIER